MENQYRPGVDALGGCSCGCGAIMPDLLWCVLWFFALPLVEARLVDWLEDEQADSPLIVSGVPTADEGQK